MSDGWLNPKGSPNDDEEGASFYRRAGNRDDRCGATGTLAGNRGGVVAVRKGKDGPSMSNWTHKKLVRRMAQWLKGTKRMTVVCAELTTRNGETPDVIGWKGGAASVLIEVKVSRADFLADKKKHFRRYAEMGMGDERYIAAPPGMIRPEEVPDRWGLLEPTPYSGMPSCYIKVVTEATQQESSKRNECVMLMSALRRLEISTAVYVVADAKGRE